METEIIVDHEFPGVNAKTQVTFEHTGDFVFADGATLPGQFLGSSYVIAKWDTSYNVWKVVNITVYDGIRGTGVANKMLKTLVKTVKEPVQTSRVFSEHGLKLMKKLVRSKLAVDLGDDYAIHMGLYKVKKNDETEIEEILHSHVGQPSSQGLKVMETEVEELLKITGLNEKNLSVSFSKVEGTQTFNVSMGKHNVGQIRQANISRNDGKRPYYFYSTPTLRTGKDNVLFSELNLFRGKELGTSAAAKAEVERFLSGNASKWKLG
jgi:hypothetical protein